MRKVDLSKIDGRSIVVNFLVVYSFLTMIAMGYGFVWQIAETVRELKIFGGIKGYWALKHRIYYGEKQGREAFRGILL